MYTIEPLLFSPAVKEFWETRAQQAAGQQKRGARDQGTRSAATGGQQMNGFATTIVKLMVKVGVKPADIYVRRKVELPGFYRPTKEWDVVVVAEGELLAAIELKSQVGPSFGNNFNNRTEEAMGTALDTWTAYREGAFRTVPAPWLGYLFLLEDCAKTRGPVRVREPHFPVFPEFREASYAKRYELFCRKLIRERQYNAACLIMAKPSKAALRRNYTEPARDLSARVFTNQLLSYVQQRASGNLPL